VEYSSIPPTLAAIAAGRDHIKTEEFARATNRASQTIRKNYCLAGECYGIKPTKFGNRLLWPVVEIGALLNGFKQETSTEPAQLPNGGIEAPVEKTAQLPTEHATRLVNGTTQPGNGSRKSPATETAKLSRRGTK
jgi:hypothetical protein